MSSELHPSIRCNRRGGADLTQIEKNRPAGRFTKSNSAFWRGYTNAPKGIRIPVAALKGRCPSPLDDGGSNAPIVTELRFPVKSGGRINLCRIVQLVLALLPHRRPMSRSLFPQCSPVKGTNNTPVTLRLVTSSPVLVTSQSVWYPPGGPTGMTSLAPSFNCWTSGWGM